MKKSAHLVFAISLLGLLGCQKAPQVGASAEPAAFNAPAPMDSETSNTELAKRKADLERLLDGRVSIEEFAAARAMDSNKQTKADESIKRLAYIVDYLGIEKLPQKVARKSLEWDFWFGQFYFYERRFVEAAQIFSQILDQKPTWLRARNLLARCFYFLGNADRSFLELQYVLTNHSGQAEELLDALFLMGAIAMDSPSATKEQVEKGVGAWKTYLKLAPHSPLRQKIEDGLSAFDAQKKKNPSETKLAGNLKDEALKSLDGSDLLEAETKIRDAIKRYPRDDDLKVALARVFVKSGRVQEALGEFQRIVSKNPKSVSAYHYQGMAFMMSGDPVKAIASWEKVLQLDPRYAERFNLQGRIIIAKNLITKDKT